MMSSQMMYRTIAGWFALVGVVVAFAVLSGMAVTLATSALFIVLGFMPPAIMLVLRSRTQEEAGKQLVQIVERGK